MTSPAEIAAGLTKAQRQRVLSFQAEPKQMGIGMMHFLPGLVKSNGIDHPIFGPHYSLNSLGNAVALAVREILKGQDDGE